MNRRMVVPLVALLMVVSQLGAATITPADIVARFYPTVLTKTSAGDVPVSERDSTFVMGDLLQSGTQVIVAVYTNGAAAAVSVLSAEGLGSEIATIAPVDMTGREAEVQLVNLGAGPRVLVTMHQQRGLPVGWLFRWSSNALVLDGPTRLTPSGRRVTDLADPSIVDLDGGGTLAIIDHQSCSEDGLVKVREKYRLLRMIDGGFSASSIDYFETFMRATGAPAVQKQEFSLSDDATARQIIIINGRRDGSGRVASCRVAVNGEVLVAPGNFDEKASIQRLSMILKQVNSVEVTLDGRPESEITLVVMPSK